MDVQPETTGKTGKTSFKNKRWLFVILAVFLMAAAGATYYWWWRPAHQPASQAAKDSAAAAKTPEGKHKQTLQEVSKLNENRQYSEEAKRLQAYVDSKPPGQYGETEVIRLAAAYMNAKEYQKAIDTYQQAQDRYPNSKFSATRGLALAYMLRGDTGGGKADYQKSLAYFEQAYAMEKEDDLRAQLLGSDASNMRYLKGKLR
jgi:tetratricopeptide (TPR) repeat protein